jgi:ADP-L-glycero-D-manno-heptose 6-epimerase
MIIITGGAGFVGSNIARALNNMGNTDIIIVDNITDEKIKNLNNLQFKDYIQKDDYYKMLEHGELGASKIEAVIHQGACTDTMEVNGNYMIKNNFNFSKSLLKNTVSKSVKFIYASSGAVYGLGKVGFYEKEQCEQPVNLYGLSKLMFDNYIRQNSIFEQNKTLIAGLRYFNVFGPGEYHKRNKGMASIILQLYDQIMETGSCYLFGKTKSYDAGEQQRDFIYIDDVVDVVLHFVFELKNLSRYSGIYNCGTEVATSFNRIAELIIEYLKGGTIDYVDFPRKLEGKYQEYTKANITNLRLRAEYTKYFTAIDVAVRNYINYLKNE